MNSSTSQQVLVKSKKMPLYKQVKEILLIWVQESENGTLLPTEEELCKRFGVSRQTIRQAISGLSEEGLVTRHPGQGTFVKRSKVIRDTRWALEDFNREMQSHGLKPETVVLSIHREKSMDFVSRQLEIAPDALVVVIKRLRFVDGWPMVVQQSYLPYALFESIESKKEELVTRSLHSIIEKDYHYALQTAERTIEAIPAPSQEADLLKVAPGSPVLYSTSIWKAASGNIVEYVLEWYRGDKSQFKIQLGRKSHREP